MKTSFCREFQAADQDTIYQEKEKEQQYKEQDQVADWSIPFVEGCSQWARLYLAGGCWDQLLQQTKISLVANLFISCKIMFSFFCRNVHAVF